VAVARAPHRPDPGRRRALGRAHRGGGGRTRPWPSSRRGATRCRSGARACG
jgi:hypothetical protein